MHHLNHKLPYSDSRTRWSELPNTPSQIHKMKSTSLYP